MPPTPSISQSIAACLKGTGTDGATLAEIYAAVHAAIGDYKDTSVRSVLYKRLPGAKSNYRPMFERFSKNGETRYRLLK